MRSARGRGRGRGTAAKMQPQPSQGAGRTFQEASKEIEANLARHLANQAGAGSSGEESEEEEEAGQEEVVDRMLGGYSAGELGAGAREQLLHALQSTCCLVCLDTVKRTDPIYRWTLGCVGLY